MKQHPRRFESLMGTFQLRRLALVAVPLLGVLMSAVDAFACSVCYGDPDSPMVKGAEAGVLFLAVVVYGVLMGMGGIGAIWFIRARRLAADNGELPDNGELLVESPEPAERADSGDDQA